MKPAPVYVLGLDVGTSSVRALLYEAGGHAVAGVEAQIAYSSDAGPGGGLTVDADRLFELLTQTIDEIVGQMAAKRISPVAVGMSCFWHSLIALDEANHPLTPVLLWGDTRSEAVVSDLTKRVSVRRLHQATGCRIHSSYWPAKIDWLNRTHPALFKTTARLVSFAEYAYFRLFGGFAVSVSMASGTGVMNTTTCAWDEYALSILPGTVINCLSPIDDAPMSGLTATFAERWPSLRHIPWFPTYGDGACSNMGAVGLSSKKLFVVTVGTSAAVRAVISAGSNPEREPELPLALWRYRVDAKRDIIGGALSEGGNLIAWLESILRLPPIDEAEELIATRSPDSGGLTVLPYIAGERSPDWAIGARATFSGVTMATQAIDFLQAAMESVAYELRRIHDLLVQTLGDPAGIVATGAALARSPVWVQTISNVLDRPLTLAEEVESSSKGAAMLVLERLGLATEDNRSRPPDQTIKPRGSAEYETAIRRQQALRQAIAAKADP